MSSGDRPFALDIKDRDNLDDEMTALVAGIEKKYGFMPNFLKFFKTDNQRLRAFVTPYMELMRADSGLSELEHEMIALVCAATNGCFYCTSHHGALLRGKTRDEIFSERLARNYKHAALSPRHRTMLDYVVKVLKDAEAIDDNDRRGMRQAGFDDEAIWSVTSTACFYASANRMSQAIGLEPAPQYFTMNRSWPMSKTNTYNGSCFCGAVQLTVSGDPAGMGYCHCGDCRLWSAGPVNAFTLWSPDAVTVTQGAEHIETYNKTDNSYRKWCRRCGGHVMSEHPGMNLIDVYAAVIAELPFAPQLHVFYGEKTVSIKDGLPKMKDLPAEMGGSGETLAE